MANSWFKHYNEAHSGQFIGDLIYTKDYETALLVYVIMEFISRFESPEKRGFCSVPIDRIARAMNMKPSRIDRLLARISSVSRSDLICETDEKQPRNRTFLMRNWLELQETRGGKREAKNEQSLTEVRSKKLEVRSQNTEVRIKKEEKSIAPSNELPEAYPLVFSDKLIQVFVERKVKAKLAKSWLETFPEPDWLSQEILKALNWEVANPRKKKIDFGKFMNNWLSRGWDTRKIQSNFQSRDQQRESSNADLYEKVLRGEA